VLQKNLVLQEAHQFNIRPHSAGLKVLGTPMVFFNRRGDLFNNNIPYSETFKTTKRYVPEALNKLQSRISHKYTYAVPKYIIRMCLSVYLQIL